MAACTFVSNGPCPSHLTVSVVTSVEQNWPALPRPGLTSDGWSRSHANEVGEQDDSRARFDSIGRGGNGGRRVPGDDVVGRIERSVDPAVPGWAIIVVEPRKLELQWIPMGVKQDVIESILVQGFDCQRQAV